ncbi:FMN-binding negative transcriptional regulator [Pelistega europaea]|uniref:FMN-binding negative transcriptional regulator n=1 Tax=Pelistega europaea TaxID=106147 RepID=A0A7Y4P4X1_9BURK|nr:FMN-binding negative transcriptional regulator [Pelistega europaea]NOL49138.1 FMN-binding negative transcriptional regulator [Pelistega europaea]
MDIPDDFKETRPAEIKRIITEFPLACIVASTPEGITATHIPLVFKDDCTLVGHMAQKNSFQTNIPTGQEVLCIFTGPQGYISANYYPSKFIDHKKVPTWNYQVVHLYGNIQYITDTKAKLLALGLLTKQSEQKANGNKEWKMSDAPKDYLMEQLNHIIAFEIHISKCLAKSKLSQNRSQQDFLSVIHELQQRGENDLADSMQRLKRS